MVDRIGAQPVRLPGSPVSPVSGAAAASQAAAVAGERDRSQASSVADVARDAGKAAPVDHERVAVLRAAIANGNYRPAPQTLADKMLGAMQEWIAK